MNINKTILFSASALSIAVLSGCGSTGTNLGRTLDDTGYDTMGYYYDRNGNSYGYDNGYGYDYDTGYNSLWDDGAYVGTDGYYGGMYNYGAGGYGYGNGVYNYGNNNAAGYNGGVSGTLYGDDSGYSAYRSDTDAERSEL